MAHKSEAALASSIEFFEQEIPIGASYHHYKDPSKTYTVLGIVLREDDESVQVLYRANYGKRLKWTRSAKEWLEIMPHDDKKVPRFTRVNHVAKPIPAFIQDPRRNR